MDKEDVVYIYIYTHTQWNITHHKKNENVPLATTWMDLKSILLSEISQRKTNTARLQLYVKSEKQTNKHNTTETAS